MDTQWITIEESFPADGEEVLLFDRKEGKHIGYYIIPSQKFVSSVDSFCLPYITHWMPLPAMPYMA